MDLYNYEEYIYPPNVVTYVLIGETLEYGKLIRTKRGWHDGTYIYGEGLGLLSYSKSFGIAYIQEKLVAFKKGNFQYGTFTPVGQLTASQEVPLPAGYNIYPNPAHTVLNIEKLPIGSQVTLLNTLGQCLYNFVIEQNEMDINVARLSKGLYFLNVRTLEGQSGMIKFVKE